MLSTVLEYALLFIAVGILFVLWPSAAEYPLPSVFVETIVSATAKAKMLTEIPIIDHVWWWLKWYMSIIVVIFTFRWSMVFLNIIPGRDKLGKFKV
jgi:hypothetical protein